MKYNLRKTIFVFGLSVTSASIAGGQSAYPTVSVSIVADESEAILAILAKRSSSQNITDHDWGRLFSSEGYVRLKKREALMQKDFTDDDFKSFVLSDSLMQRYEALNETVEKWKSTNVEDAAKRALAYLPAGASIKTKVYPVIKPRTNSFVFEVTENPGIFLYVDPDVTQAKFENTLAHELHHIGYENSCATMTEQILADHRLSKSKQKVLYWIGGFGEGFAMLAAAGGPGIHPHVSSEPNEKQRWDRDMKNVNQDLRQLEKFFLDILDEKLSSDEIDKRAFSFYGVQGAWYTVGWIMGATIERVLGRDKLIESICDPRYLLQNYNRAVLHLGNQDSFASWSSELIRRIAE